MSDATWQLADGKLPGARAADLGWHRLKDIAEPEHLHQLLIGGLPAQFPPLRSLGNRGSLPEPPAPLLGRGTDLAAVTDLAGGAGAARIVTLTGPGGVGKSRLALAVARAVDHRFADGVYFVPLATVHEAPVMWTTIAEGLGVTGDGRRDQFQSAAPRPGRDAPHARAGRLRARALPARIARPGV